MPMRRMRSASLGGLPSGSPSVAEVTPMRDCAAAEAANTSALVPSRAARKIDRPTDVAMSTSLDRIRHAMRRSLEACLSELPTRHDAAETPCLRQTHQSHALTLGAATGCHNDESHN